MVRGSFAISTSADLILEFKIFKTEVELSPRRLILFLPPPTPSQTKMEWCIGYACRESLEQIAGSSSAPVFKKVFSINGSKYFLKPLCNCCSPSPAFFSIFFVTLG